MSEDLFVSYLPDLLVSHFAAARPAGPELRAFPAAVFFADIKGFTPLTAELAKLGPAGAEKLSFILDGYFGRMLGLIAAHGGSAVKFAGDALIAIWPAVHETMLDDATLRAAQCGLVVQALLDQLDVGDQIRMSLRVGIGAGDVTAIHVGATGHEYFLVAGRALVQIAAAKAEAQPGEVVLSAAAAELLEPLADLEPRGASCARLRTVRAPVAPRAAWRTQVPREVLAALEPYVPAPVRARLAAGHAEWLAELRRVSVLFLKPLDLDPVSPDALADVQRFLETVQPVFDRYQGFVKELIYDDQGPTLVAIFGLPPQVHEDDAARAVEAALAVKVALEAHGERAAMGVTTGRAFCGAVGSELGREYTVVGDVMNIAARLMTRAEQGILCDEATFQAARARVGFETLAPIQVKGKSETMAVHRPVAVGGAAAEIGEIVGLDAERARVRDALAALGRGVSGSVVVEGEPGLGKSRLLTETRRLAAELGLRTVSGAGLAVEATTPYRAWRGVLEELLGLGALADVAARRAAVEGTLPAGQQQRAPLIDAVLPLGFTDNAATQRLSGQARADATRDLVVALVASALARRPAVILLEDAHWFDPASWQLALEIGRRVEPLLMVVATRPLPEPPREWAALLERAAHLVLAPLSPAHTLTLVCQRLGVARLPEPVAELIRAKADGHPLFSEQLAYALRDRGLIELVGGECRVAPGVELAAASLPDTVQGVITSRIDRLSPQEQLTLKVASVIGAAFGPRLLHDVHPIDADRGQLPQQLSGLERAQLVLPLPGHDQRYGFKHVIVREVAYNLLLFAQRRKLHRHIAEWHEGHSADLAPLYGLLAYHWAQAEARPKAVEYLEKAAIRTFSMGLGKQSVDLGLQAARLLGLDLPTDPNRIRPLIGTEMVRIQELLAGRPPAALLDLPALANPEVAAQIQLLLRIGPFAFQSLQPELFALIALRNLGLTLEHGNGPAAADVYSMYSIVYGAMTGDRRTAYDFSELARTLDARSGRGNAASVGFVHTWFHSHWARPLGDSVEISRESAAAGFDRGDVLFACFNLSGHVCYLAAAGRPLDEVATVAKRHLGENGERVVNAAFHCKHELQLAKALAGRTASPQSLSDAEFDEERDIASICQTDYFNQIACYLVSKLRLGYLFGDLVGALAWAEKVAPMLDAFQGQVSEIDWRLYHALALLGRAGEVDERAALLQAAAPHREKLAHWSQLCPANFRHLHLLVEAEQARVSGEGGALGLYREAAAHAEAGGFVQHAALAHELAARHLGASGDPRATEALSRARASYQRWGAHAKVAALSRA